MYKNISIGSTTQLKST